MQRKAKVIAIAAHKGGVGKTATTINLGVALVMKGYKVLLVDCDKHASLTIRLGHKQPDALTDTLASVMAKIMQEATYEPDEAVQHQDEGLDFVPSNRRMADIDIGLVGMMSRETVLRTYIEALRPSYDYILLDCLPSLSLLEINALASADEVLLVTKADYDSAKGVEDILNTIASIRKRINSHLKIKGILFTMVNIWTLDARDTIDALRTAYDSNLHFFGTYIPASVKVPEAGKRGVSIFKHDQNCSVASAYSQLAEEVILHE